MHRIQRKPSNETLTSVGMDSTIDSRMSSAEVPQMELLKVNYVHQCKEAFMNKTGSVANYNFMDFKKCTPHILPQVNRKNIARITVNRLEAPNKPLPPPPPTIESWQLLQNSKRTLNSSPKFHKKSSANKDKAECSPGVFHTPSDTANDTDTTTHSGEAIKSNSWSYRNKMSTCDIRRDLVRAGIKSRADRIAHIERSVCEHSKTERELAKIPIRETAIKRTADSNVNPKEAVAKINKMFEAQMQLKKFPPQPNRPAPVPHKEPNRRLELTTNIKEQSEIKTLTYISNDGSDCSECSKAFSNTNSSSSDSCSLKSQETVQYRRSESKERSLVSRIPKPIQDKSTTNSNIRNSKQIAENECLKRNERIQKAKSIEHIGALDPTRNPAAERRSLGIDQQLLRNTKISAVNYQKAKVERVHIRKKRQPLIIINQLNEPDLKRSVEVLNEFKTTCGYKNCILNNCPISKSDHENTHKPNENDCNKLKRLSLESNSDSGVSSSHDFKQDKTIMSQLKNVDKCSDVQKPYKSEHFKNMTIKKFKNGKDFDGKKPELKDPNLPFKVAHSQVKIVQSTFNSHYNTADPNDVNNFAKKNLTKATTNEALNNSSSVVKPVNKVCNIENEQILKIQNNLHTTPDKKSTTNIKIDDDWVREEGLEPQEEYMECDSLIITEKPIRKPINCNDNAVKIFIRSSQLSNDLCRSSCASANSLVSQTSMCTQNSTNSSCSLNSSSNTSASSSGCGSSNADNQSLCNSDRECCCQLSNSAGLFFNRPCSALSQDHQRLCAGSPISSTDAISDISSCLTCSTSPSTIIAPLTLADNTTQCCKSINGVFWNNSYIPMEDQEENNLPSCCCSISSCDEDNCSLYVEERNQKLALMGNDLQRGVEIDHIKGSSLGGGKDKELKNLEFVHSYRQLPTRNLSYQSQDPTQQQLKSTKRNVRNSSAEEILIRNQLLRKTDVIHELRPRSMDGVIDSGVSLNGDSSCGPDSGDHLQNQQDSEARRLKRGHVLSELLETERIYVSEMSSILKANSRFWLTFHTAIIMRYGGYDLQKASKASAPAHQGSFRLKKVQNTACHIMGKFNTKLHDSIKKLYLNKAAHLEASRNSPLSFRGSLFDSENSSGYIRRIGSVRYDENDFRPHFDMEECKDYHNYIFGTNVYNFSARNILNGKSTIKILNTFKEIEESNSLESIKSAKNSLQRLKEERKTIFKELLELSSCDESLEYRLVKDYLECNSYSEIENDIEFKDYLQRKNYTDILSYLNECQEPKSFTSISSSVARAQTALGKGSLNSLKLLSTPKSLKEPKKTPEVESHVCRACRSSLQAFTPFNHINLKAPKLRDMEDKPKTNIFSTSYREILKFCHEFFEESFKQNNFEMPKFTFNKFKEQKYEQILKDFVSQQGYERVQDYVEDKFGKFIEYELSAYCNDLKSAKSSETCDENLSERGYCDQMHSEEMIHLVPASLQGKEDILFGNLHELYTFHNDIFLKDLENCISTTELVALCFVQRRDTFYRLYSFYCQNIPRSDRLRETLVDTHLFLQECQKRLGHKLPLAAYLLKPVQRITKYQLLLKDLLRFSDSGSCTKELQKALDCMLIVLKCVNDSMHQVAITGFPTDLSQQGELLLQDSFQVWSDSKKDIRLRIKPQQRHIFLYQKSMLFCKQTSKPGHNKSTYQFKNYLKMSQIGLTESVRGDTKRFEVWLQGRQEVHTLQAPTIEIKNKWVAEIKRVLLNQLEELKGEKIKQYGLNHRGLRQTTSWDTPNIIMSQRTISCDASSESSNRNSNCSSSDDNCIISALPISSNMSMTSATSTTDKEHNEACGWSSDYSNSEDEMSMIEDNSTPGSKFVALADYVAVGHSEVSMREGDNVELLKVGCAGWWYVRILDTNAEGWTPAAYLEAINRKSSRSSSRNQERLNFNKLND